MIGSVEMRRSIDFPRTIIFTRPSCGSRRSAMSSRAMILIRETTAARSRSDSGALSCKMPSIR